MHWKIQTAVPGDAELLVWKKSQQVSLPLP